MQIRLNERLFEMATASEKELEALLKMIGCNASEQNKNIATGLYEKLMHSLYPVRIQTFHSFCQDILSRPSLWKLTSRPVSNCWKTAVCWNVRPGKCCLMKHARLNN